MLDRHALARKMALADAQRRKEEEEGSSASSSTPAQQTQAPDPYLRWSTYVQNALGTDNEPTAQLRNFMAPSAQAARANRFHTQSRNASNPYTNPENAALYNPYAKGTVLYDVFETMRTGQGTPFNVRSALGQIDNYDAYLKMGINNADLAIAARNDVHNQVLEAMNRGQEAAPIRYDRYADRNAGKGYTAFGGQAGDVHEYGLAYENVLAAMATKQNRKDGRMDSEDTLRAGDYASLSDKYIDDMISKISDYVAGLDDKIDSGSLYDQEYFQRMSLNALRGEAYSANDLYEYARTMFPGENWSTGDFDANGDPDKIAKITAAVESDIADMRAGKGSKVLNAYDAVKGERMTAQSMLDDLRKEKINRSTIADLEKRYALENGSADYTSMVDVDEKGTDIVSKLLYMNLQSQQRGNWDDEENAWLQDIAGQLGGRISFNDYSGEGYQLMTADEVALVNKVWNATHDPIKTQEAFDALASTLRSRRMNFDEDTWAYRSDAYGSLMTDLASIGMQGYANIEGLGNAIQGLFGNQDVKDVTSDEWRTQSSVNAIRGYTGQQAYNSGGAWAKFAHDAGLAIGDEAMKFLPALAGGPLAQQAASAIAGMAQGTYGAYERGVDNPWLAAGEGAMNAAIEALTENVGLEAPSNSSMRAGKHWLQQIAAEAGEEGLSEILNKAGSEMLADATGTVSANDQAYMEAIKNSTEKDRTKRHLLAQQAVADQNIEDVLYSTAMGGVVGGALSAPSSIGLNKQQRKTGKAVASNSNSGALMEVAMSLDEGSDARQLAETLKAQADKGKKPSNGQLGRLYATVAKDLDAQSAAVVTQTMQDAIVDEMVDKGENEEVARRAAPILAKQLRGEKLTDADTSALAESKTAITMMEELNKYTEGGKEDGPVAGLFKSKSKGTQVTDEQIQAVEDMLVERGDSAKAAKRAAPLLARVANGDTLTESEQAFVDQTEGSEEIVSKLRSEKTGNKPLQRPAWVEDVETRQAVYAAPKEKDIATKGKALLDTTRPSNQTAIAKSADKAKTLTVKDGAAKDGVRDTTAVPLGSKESVDIQRIESDNDGVLKLVTKDSTGKESKTSYKTLSFKGGSVGHVITHAVDNYAGNAEMANLMYQSYTGGDSTQYIAEMDAAYRAGFDASTVNRDSMTQYKGVAKHAFELGQKQAQEAEQTRLKNIGKAKLGKGRVTIPASVNETKLSKQQRNQVAIVRRIADATGINFTFFESQADATGMYKAENGSYDGSTNSIRLDLNAGKNFKGDIAEYAIVRTAAHEMTHFIEANSGENYAKMRQFIADELARKGLNFNSLVQAKIDRSPVPLTRGGAIAEVVADGCEMMLKDSEAIQRLMQKDASLGDQIKKVLKEFVGRIRKAFENIRPGSDEAKALMDEVDGVLKYADELQKLWDTGLEEAVEATRGAPDAFVAAHPKAEQFAVRDLSQSLNLRMEVISDGVESAPFRLLDNNGNEVTKFTPEMMRNTPMGTLIDAAVGAGTITEEVAHKQREMFADLASLCAKYKENNLVWELAGAELFSAIKNNSDKQYSTTVDFGTICAKTQAIIEVMSETMLKQGRGLTRAEVIKVYNATANAGLSVPCPVCYVFSRWMGVPSLLNNMAKYQRRFTGMSAEDVTAYVNSVEARYSAKGKTVASSIAKAKTSLEAQLERVTKDLQLASARKEDTTMLEERARQLEAEYADVEAYNWVTQVYCKRRKSGKNFEQVRDSNGVLVLNENYRPVPESILFDLRRTGEFAAYPSSWLYRTTRGAGMGKAILPYSGSAIGDSVYASQKRKSESQNAFLQQNEKGGTRAIKNAQKRAQRQNLIGGQRFQSTSDYRPEWGLDYLMTFLEMQAIGAKGQLYTKVIEAVDMFATAGIEVNLSIMPKGKGYHTDENGNNVLAVEDFSSVTGIDFQQALEKTQKYDNVQMILVGVSDEHIRLAMADDRIGFIIPWHASGNSKDVLSQLVSAVGEVLNDSTDYTETQSDKVLTEATEAQKRARNVRTKILTKGYSKGVPDADMEIINGNKYLQRLYERFYVKGIDPEAYGVKLSSDQASQIFPHEYWDTTLTIADADENGRRFVEYCKALGIQPRFPQFAGEPGYWKLLIDRRMYNRNGTYHHPKTIDVTNVKVGDVATSVSVARYGDSVLTDKAVQEAIDRIKAETPPPAFEGIDAGMGNNTQYSLRTVPAVVPRSRDSEGNLMWQSGHSEQWFRDNGFPIYEDVPLEQQNINRNTETKGHGTQIASTVSTYKQLFQRLKDENPDTWQSMRVLDASSGLGLGTQAGREMGFDVTDIEPFPSKRYNPMYTDYSLLQDMVESGEVEPFDYIISNAVLNVIPQDTRDNLVVAMGSLLKPGGKMFINVISKPYAGAVNSNPDLTESLATRKGAARTMEGDYANKGNVLGRGHETFVWGSNSVQKVFSYNELSAYLVDALGDGYTVQRDKIGMTGVTVTKTNEAAGRQYSPRAAYGPSVLVDYENGTRDSLTLEERHQLDDHLRYRIHHPQKGEKIKIGDDIALTVTEHEDNTKLVVLRREAEHQLTVKAIYLVNPALYNKANHIMDLTRDAERMIQVHGAEWFARMVESFSWHDGQGIFWRYDRNIGQFIKPNKESYNAQTPAGEIGGTGGLRGRYGNDDGLVENVKFSLRTPAPATTRDYLLSLTDADLSTAGEKDAMMRYRVMVDELRELEEKRAAQQEIAATATGDDRIKAKNRADIYTVQIDRLNDRIRGKENTNVLRPIVAEAKAILEANRQLEIGRPVETVIKGMGGKVRDAEAKLNRFREKVKQERDAREKITASRRRITKMVKYLDTLRRKESDYKHVPEELKPTVNALVAAFAEHSSMVFDSRRAERIAQAYSKLQALDNDLAAYYDPDVQARIEYIADLMELKRGKPMTLAEMEIIEDVVGAIYKMVRGSNEAFFENQMMDIAQIAADVADEMLQRKDRSYWVNSKYEDALDTLIRNGNLTPVYYFDNLNNAMLKRLGYDILGGQDKYGLYQRDDRVTMGEIRKKYNYNSWRNDKPIVHNDVQFTKEQALWVYATAKREATNELAQTHHLDEGGIVFEGGEVVGADGKKRKRTTPMRLSAKDVQAITSTLTEEQKGYADAVVQHLSTTVGERGNEVSMRMYGFRKYREQYYFPYKTASDQRHQTSVSNAVSATNDARLKHQSFSNPLKKGANTPLVIGDFTAMATSHMNAMNTYAAMVIPVENMNRVLNRKTEIDGAVTTLRGLMAQKYGDSTKRYLETLLKDLNGGAQVDNRSGGLIDKTVGMYKKGAVVGSASVVLQQWTSIFRAAYMINPKYLAGATFRKRDWDELTKYSGVATIKDMGRFDVNVGVGGSNWLAADADDFNTWEKAKQRLNPRDWETFKTRWDDAVNFLPGWADRVTWAQIWNAVKAEQAELHPGMDKSSDAFLKMCAERFNDIINHTQVYDSTMTRSQLMRSKGALDKMATAFGSEPTMILNMVYDAIHNPAYKGKRKGKIGAGIATVTLSQLAAAAMQALASAWRKDDDERKALEKFLDKWSYNFADNMNPFTMFPYMRDVWDTFATSYDVERSDMALFSELKDALTKLNNDSYSPYRKVEELAGTLAKFAGIPLKNIMRDLRSAYNAILKTDWSVPEASSIGYTLLDNLPFRDSSKTAYYQRMENAYASGDEERADDIAQYLESNDTTADAVGDKLSGMLKRMLAAGNDAAVGAILADMAARGRERDGGDLRSIINDLYKNGEIDWQQAERLYKKHTNLTSANDLYWHKQDLDYKGEGNYSAYRAAREALLAGDKKTYLAEKSRLLTHGKKGSSVMGETVTNLKDELLALYETDITAARKLREMIVWAYMECGKTKDSANKIIDGWFKD